MFKTIDEVKEYLSHNKIECLICGKKLKSLATHVSLKHGVSGNEYRERFGIPKNRALLCVSTLEKFTENLIKLHREGKMPAWKNLTKEQMCKKKSKLPPCLKSIGTAARAKGLKSRIKNAASKTHCKKNHELNDSNTYLYRNLRVCKTCVNENKKAFRARKKELRIKTKKEDENKQPKRKD